MSGGSNDDNSTQLEDMASDHDTVLPPTTATTMKKPKQQPKTVKKELAATEGGNITFKRLLLSQVIVFLLLEAASIATVMAVAEFKKEFWQPLTCEGTLARSILPLWLDVHETKSIPFVHSIATQSMLSSIEHSLREHLRDRPRYVCLCSHHLVVPQHVRVCAITGALGQVHTIINPFLSGFGNTTVEYQEASVSCAAGPIVNRRFYEIRVTWLNPNSLHEPFMGHFSGVHAACLQLAMDEMDGNKHCVPQKK
jgi:peptide deformylase